MASEGASEEFDKAVVKNPSLEASKFEMEEKFFENNMEKFRSIFGDHIRQMQKASLLLGEKFNTLAPVEKEKITKDLNDTLKKNEENQKKPQEEWEQHTPSQETLSWIANEADFECKNGRFENAKALYYFALTLDGRNPTFWINYGYSLQKLEQWEKAIEAYTMCHMIDDSILHARYYSAECYIQLSLFSDAQIELSELENQLTTPELHEEWDPYIKNLQPLIGE